MKTELNVISVFILVTVGALVGMVLGGLFGMAAGRIGPDLFVHFLPWKEFEPVGVATVIGAAGGVLCGGALMAFAVVIQFLSNLITGRRRS